MIVVCMNFNEVSLLYEYLLNLPKFHSIFGSRKTKLS